MDTTMMTIKKCIFFTLNTIVVRLYAIRTCELSIVILLSKLLGFSFENSTSNCAI